MSDRPSRPRAARPPSAKPSRTRPPGRPGKAAAGATPPAGDAAARKLPDRRLYGVHAVAAAWTNPERTCRALWLTDGAAGQLAPALAAARAAGLDRPAPEPVERAWIDKRVPAGAVHQGVLVEVEPLPPTSLEDLIRAGMVADKALVLALDQVTDPHNVGAILRSTAAFGALGLVVTHRHAPEVTAVLAKTASGAVEHVPIVRVTNLARALEDLGAAGFTRIGLAEAGDELLGTVALPDRVCLVLGAEGDGLRERTKATCDRLVRLPTGGPIGSLNVSNAAAVALFEVHRQHGPRDPDG